MSEGAISADSQFGERSCAATERVMLRSSPFSAGTVMISPRNSSATRAPEGERLEPRTYFGPFA